MGRAKTAASAPKAMPANARPHSLILGTVLLASVGAVVLLAAWWSAGGQAAEPLDPGSNTAMAVSEGGESMRAPVEQGERPGGEGGQATPLTQRLLCLRAADLQPVAGIRLYSELETVAGPSGDDGVLDVPKPPSFLVTVWGEGWLPREFVAVELPEQVLLERADSTLEVRLQNMLPGHVVRRSLLQPHTRHAKGDGPWFPEFDAWSVDRYGAEGIPGDTYDVYFWVSEDGGEPRPFSQIEVAIPSGERIVLHLDLSTPPEPEEDH